MNGGEALQAGFTLSGAGLTLGGRHIVSPLDLDLRTNRIYGLIGPNGSGKSSLLRMMTRQVTPSSGEIRYRGGTLGGWASRAFAREVAYLPQQLPSGQQLTVGELVALGRYPWHGPFRRLSAEDRDSVAEAISITDLRELESRLVDTLSGGERQRAWVAMMVAQAGRFLMLDEPTSALDIGHQAQLLEVLREVAAARGLGIVMAFHDINIAASFCDEVLAMRDGVLMAVGAPADIVTDDVLSALYGVPMRTMPHPETQRPIGFIR